MNEIKLSSAKGVAVAFLSIVFFGVFVWGIALELLPLKTTFWNYTYNIANGDIYILGGVLGYIFGHSRKESQSMKRAINYMVLAQVAWGMASLIWAGYNIFFNIEVPFPSFADIFYIAYSVFLMIAIWHLLSGTNTRITRDSVNGSVFVVFVSYVLIAIMYTRLPLSADVSFIESISNFIYPLLETFLLAASFIAFRLGGDSIKQSILMIFIAVFFQLVGDFMFAYSSMSGVYWNGGFTDVAYTISGFVLSFAIISFGTSPVRDTKNLVA
jgi:hypothetical protein